MSILDKLSDLIGGADEQLQQVTDTLQGVGGGEAIQDAKDRLSELGTQAEDVKGSLGEQAQGVVDSFKDKLGQ